jgi:O-6-methylguanine DNA methyltransferase
MTNAEKVYQMLRKIPEGKVLTYGKLAKLTGIKNPRVVGSILHKNPQPMITPCHRVVNAAGKVTEKFGGGGAKVQTKLLSGEGVEVINGKVDLEKYLWQLKSS